MNHQFSPAHHKQRVVTTHYGQLAESITVRGDAEAADAAISSILPQVLVKTFEPYFFLTYEIRVRRKNCDAKRLHCSTKTSH